MMNKNFPVLKLSNTKAKLLMWLVKLFPRRLIPTRLIHIKDKFIASPLILKKDISPTLNNLNLAKDMECLINDEGAIQQIMQHQEALPEAVYRQRIAQGDSCFILLNEKTVVAYNWVSHSKCAVYRGFAREVEFLVLNSEQAFTYDFYTYKNHRNKGYGLIVKQFLIKYLAQGGVKAMLTCVHHDNHASLAVHFNIGYKPIAVVYLARIMNWTISFQSGDKELYTIKQWFEQYIQFKNSKKISDKL